ARAGREGDDRSFHRAARGGPPRYERSRGMIDMHALVLSDTEKLELRQIERPAPAAREALIEVSAVGLCGTDFHIYEGRANYNTDSTGRVIPLSAQPQILGHEFC